MTERKGTFEVSKSIAIIFLVFGVLLGITNFFLFQENGRLVTMLQQHTQALEPKVGARLPGLLGFDLKGKLTPVTFGQGRRRTLILVFSPTCGICDKNWPNWEMLLNKIDPSTVRVIGINLYYELPETYVKDHELTRIETIARVDPESVIKWNLRLTPQTLLVDSDGEVNSVWTGLLQENRMDEVANALGVQLSR